MQPPGIPEWNAQGLLPPIDIEAPNSAARSPYVIPLSEVIQRLGMTPERCALLDGLLAYRALLHSVGLTDGFQWLDGSFVENIKAIDGRPPHDIDVVTFYRPPDGVSDTIIVQQLPILADPDMVRQAFRVDAYLAHLSLPADILIEVATYWYGMWSHRRGGVWKGYLQIDLSPDEDAAASTVLASLTAEGAHS